MAPPSLTKELKNRELGKKHNLSQVIHNKEVSLRYGGRAPRELHPEIKAKKIMEQREEERKLMVIAGTLQPPRTTFRGNLHHFSHFNNIVLQGENNHSPEMNG